eukprot:CAMPEP_0118967462 /NCGR_PEP_ID=MMETSP1173-20130426/4837_1 /TAXON_ID=1034831 /ORGANISM="Rhizochromulina marina cf, Strain CCMP1243" /LENGTH=477 /DNA_ID=CAMNT_0006916431 /DNA_START=30 /DNA_END=1463 /DNA_ORIENTATION=+
MAGSVAALLFLLAGTATAWAPLRPGRLAPPSSRSALVRSAAPESGEATVKGSILVSGFISSQDRTDSFGFDALNKLGIFEKIIAYSTDSAFAKKRLIGRNARYTGLLDVLDFAEGTEDALVGAESPLKGCDAWLAFGVAPGEVRACANAAAAAGVKRAVMVVTGECAEATQIVSSLSPTSLTVLQCGEFVEGTEGGAVEIKDAGVSLPAGAQIARDEAIRVATESLIIPLSEKKAVGLLKGDKDAEAHVKELRTQGMSRTRELENLFNGSFAVFLEQKAAREKEEAEKAAEEERQKAEFEERQKELEAEEAELMKPLWERNLTGVEQDIAMRAMIRLNATYEANFVESEISYAKFRAQNFRGYYDWYSEWESEHPETKEPWLPPDEVIQKAELVDCEVTEEEMKNPNAFVAAVIEAFEKPLPLEVLEERIVALRDDNDAKIKAQSEREEAEAAMAAATSSDPVQAPEPKPEEPEKDE